MRDLTLMNSKHMKTFYLSAAALLLSLNLFAQDVKSEKFTPFYTKDEAPHMERVIPNPPELTDAQFFYGDAVHFPHGCTSGESHFVIPFIRDRMYFAMASLSFTEG